METQPGLYGYQLILQTISCVLKSASLIHTCGTAFGTHGLSCLWREAGHSQHAAIINSVLHQSLAFNQDTISCLEPAGLPRWDGERSYDITTVPWSCSLCKPYGCSPANHCRIDPVDGGRATIHVTIERMYSEPV